MPKPSDEMISVRVEAGTKAKLRAASGQDVSTLVRWMIMGFLKKKEAERSNMPMFQQAAVEAMQVGADQATKEH